MYTKGDFHMHTTISDGDYSPSEVVAMAKEKGLDIIAITDHNSVNGIEEAIMAGEKHGIKVLPGIELSVRLKGEKVHLLGYFINENYKEDIFKEGIRLIKKHNIEGLKELMGDKISVTKDIIRNRVDVQTGIEFFRYFGATVILAHPIKVKYEIFREIINLDIDGIEAKYFKNEEVDTLYFKKIALEKGLIYTAGSDFHTDKRIDKRHGFIGQSTLDTEEIFNFLVACDKTQLALSQNKKYIV